jgi:hypothetical protein
MDDKMKSREWQINQQDARLKELFKDECRNKNLSIVSEGAIWIDMLGAGTTLMIEGWQFAIPEGMTVNLEVDPIIKKYLEYK